MDKKNSIQRYIVGSSEECDFVISHPSISAHHLEVFQLTKSEFFIRDISKSGETIVERKKIAAARIDSFTPIKIGKLTFTLRELMGGQSKNNTLIGNGYFEEEKQQDFEIKQERIYQIGSGSNCDIILPSARINKIHLKLQNKDNRWIIQTKAGKKIYEEIGERFIRLGNYTVTLKKSPFLSITYFEKNRIDIKNIYVKTTGSNYLIRNFSLNASAGEFIGIIGPSGCGKTVLLRTIRGIFKAESGKILVNNINLFEHPQSFKDIAYIPQDDVVYPALTVEENLKFSTALRVPSNWENKTTIKKVQKILKDLYLEDCKNIQCSKISGGQRKRVNLATEMVLDPIVILADEVTTGLSAWDTDNILRHLRRIADKGKIVFLTIHSPDIEALDLMDKLLVMDKGGFIAYYGPASESMQYFSRRQHSPYKSPKLIFDILEKRIEQNGQKVRHTSPVQWNQIYEGSIYYQKYIEESIKELENFPITENKPKQNSQVNNQIKIKEQKRYNHIKQIIKLTQRRLLSFFRDKMDLSVTYGQTILMALSFFFVFKTITDSDLFIPLQDYRTPHVIIFLASLAAVWFGFSKSIEEIPASKIFYNQDRLSFLKNFDFVISRFISLAIITLGQVFIFSLFFHLFFSALPAFIYEPSSFNSFFDRLMLGLFLKFTLLLWFISIASIATAMFVSSFIKSAAAAKAVLPFLLIIQILFAGSIQPFPEMTKPVYHSSQAMVSRWGYEAAVLLFEKELLKDQSERNIIIKSEMKFSSNQLFKDKIDEMSLETIDNLRFFEAILSDSIKKVTDDCLLVPTLFKKELIFLKRLKEKDYKIEDYDCIPHTIECLIKKDLNYRDEDGNDEPPMDKLLDNIKKNIDIGKKLDANEKELWNWMKTIHPRVAIFRPIHFETTLIYLLILTFALMVGVFIAIKIFY